MYGHLPSTGMSSLVYAVIGVAVLAFGATMRVLARK